MGIGVRHVEWFSRIHKSVERILKSHRGYFSDMGRSSAEVQDMLPSNSISIQIVSGGLWDSSCFITTTVESSREW